MKKKMKCMADGGMPQERPKKEEEIPEWKKTLAKLKQAIAGTSEPQDKPPTADSLGDTAKHFKDRGRQLQEIASYANGGMPGQVEAFQSGVQPMAVSTGITPPSMVPTEAQGLAAVGAPTGGALTAAAQQAPIPAATPGNVFANPQAGNMLTPSGGSMTMAEKSRAAGLDPNAAYRPGSAQDPHASGLSSVTPAQRIASSNITAAALAPNQQVPQLAPNPLDVRSSRQRRGFADGGKITPNFLSLGEIAGGLKDAIVDPIVSDWRQGNKALKKLRDKNQTIDNLVGIHPYAAAAQVANDVMADDEDGGTAMNVAQAIPIVKRATMLAKVPNLPGVGRLSVNMPATFKKNAIITSAQTLGQPATAFADGGMARHRFEGKGGPRDDQIPVTVAGEKIKVSDGEEAVILPVKTAQNPQAIAAIGQVIEQSNDGRKPAMGMSEGGKYRDGSKPPTAPEMYAPVYDGLSAAFPNTAQAGGNAIQATKQAIAEGRWPAAIGQAGRGMALTAQGVLQDVNNSAAYALQAPASAIKTFATGDNAPIDARPAQPGMAPAQQAATYSNEGRPSAIQTANTTPDPIIAQNTGNAGDARVDPASGNLHFTQKGFDPTQQQFAQGSGAITDPKTGRTILVPPQAIAQAPDNAPRDRHGNDMTQTFALRDELNRARADRAWQNMNSPTEGYRQQGMAQLQALAQIGALDTESIRRLGMKQQNDANIPGADSQLKGQAIAQGELAMQQAQELNALYQAHNAEQNPEKRSMIAEQIRVRTGKDKPAKYKTAILGGAKTFDGTEADRGYVVNEQTGEMMPMGMIGAPSQTTNQEVPPAGERKIGQTYKTPQGPMIWRGNGWEKAA